MCLPYKYFGVICVCMWKLSQSNLMGINLQQITKLTDDFMAMFDPSGDSMTGTLEQLEWESFKKRRKDYPLIAIQRSER